MPTMIHAIHGQPDKNRRMKKKGRIAKSEVKKTKRPKTLKELIDLVMLIAESLEVEVDG